MNLLYQFSRSNFVNIFLYFLGCIALASYYKFPESVLNTIVWIPSILFFINLMLSFIFNKSKLFFITLMMLIAYLVLLFPNDVNQFQKHILVAISLSFPLNILFFSKTQERGIISRNGKFKLITIALEFIVLFYLLIVKEHLFISINEYTLFSSFNGPFIVINQIVTIVFLAVLFYFLVSDLLKPYLVKNVCLFITMFVFMAFMKYDTESWYTLCFIFANLINLIALMKKSYKMAYHDDLTGIPGRRALNEDLDKISGMYSIAMVDIDFFKKFNDKYGHDVGDEALRYVARTIDKAVEKGKLYRFGGEEFTIIYPNLAKEEVMINLEYIRREIKNKGFSSHSNRGQAKNIKKIKLTISIGVSDHKDIELRPYEVMKKADKGLYAAKKKGRNCISRF